ncbi:sensor histidine kinase [Phytomonospora endophytica]|uniref:Signal transduction histidine-protein kinase/phosphatase MprB n=1 Tax=Phytomonospora endophytica TaxID=714109 RepID=A0A841FB01_9ACTN|nr:ATP-binding protein [Phytomonospora endophytica]MBB6032465.1 signal transduction histidine kinase [Phytomonospora endophytica]GIG66387.1 two-component sensor histidine kinase [Phytomonospora endophytica]
MTGHSVEQSPPRRGRRWLPDYLDSPRARASDGGPVTKMWIWLGDVAPRPLDRVRSVKIKFTILLVGSGTFGLLVFWSLLGFLPWDMAIIAILGAVFVSRVLAHGMTSPLREMTAGVRKMARGDYDVRVRATAQDEVGVLAEAFNQMAGELAAVDRQRRELIANVSHELRTPITALQAVLENVVDGVSTADEQTLRTALAQTERLSRLVGELLDVSRLDAGVVPLRRKAFEVLPLLRRAAAEQSLSGRDVTVHVDAPAGLTAEADPARLHQVVANLLDNAVRHSPTGATVTVTAGRDTDGAVLIDVADQGPGIPLAERQRVFERFTRGDNAARFDRRDGGTGLGLAISRWIAELHGGQIAVLDSAHGCLIRVRLPDPHLPTEHGPPERD